MKYHDAKIAELGGDGGALTDATIPGLFVVVGEPLVDGHLAASRNSFLYQALGDTGGHQVKRPWQEDYLAPFVIQLMDQFFEGRLAPVPPVQGDEDGVLQGDASAGHGDLNGADPWNQVNVVNPPPHPVQ